MPLFPWFRSTPVVASREVKPSTVASIAIRESRIFVRAVHMRVGIAIILVFAMLGYLWIAFTLLGTQNSDPQSAPRFELKPLSGATLVAAYAGLGGVSIALQFGARSVLGASTLDPRSTARALAQRAFLSTLAWAALLSSILLGILSVFWFSGFPNVDAARTAGPLVASTFLAYVAAETHALLESPFDKTIREVLLLRRRRRLKHIVETRLPAPLTKRRAWTMRLGAFVLVPILCTAASHVTLPPRDSTVLAGRVGIIVFATFTAYALVLTVTQALIDREPVTLVSVIGISFLVGLVLLVTALQTLGEDNGEASTWGDIARGMLGTWIFVVIAPLAIMCAAAGPRGFILGDVRMLLQRRIRQLQRATSNTQTRRPLGRLVVWAWVAAPIFPFGILIGRYAARDARVFQHRGARSAMAAAWTCAAMATAGVLTAAIAAFFP